MEIGITNIPVVKPWKQDSFYKLLILFYSLCKTNREKWNSSFCYCFCLFYKKKVKYLPTKLSLIVDYLPKKQVEIKQPPLLFPSKSKYEIFKQNDKLYAYL